MVTKIELSKNNLIYNFHLFKKLLPNQVKIVAVIKANAYGHGQNEIAQVLEPFSDFFQVDDLQELTKLREVSQKPTVVLGYIAPEEFEQILELDATIVLYNLEQLSTLEKAGQKSGKTPHVFLMIDAFLGRDGILIENIAGFLQQIRKYNINLDGIYAHFSNLEDTQDTAHAKKQIATFEKARQICQEMGFINLQTHISATAAILTFQDNLGLTSARLGIGIYGLWPSELIRQKFENQYFRLKPVLQWVTKVAQVKNLPTNFPIGYGCTYITNKSTKIALIPQGYSDGYDRKLSNNGEVLISGSKCKVLGRIAMNMFVVDITHLPDVKIGDEVVLIGNQGNEEVTAEEIARKIESINYEVVARINPLLPRVVK